MSQMTGGPASTFCSVLLFCVAIAAAQQPAVTPVQTPGYSPVQAAGAPMFVVVPPAQPQAPASSAAPPASASPDSPPPAAVVMPGIGPRMGVPFPTLAGRLVAPDETTTTPAATEAAALAPDGSLHQGVQVHGHWVINVADPDGKQVQHHEYENSLIEGGPGLLVGLLSGYLVPGDWMIVLSPNFNPLGACVSTVSVQACGLVHNAATYPAQTICSSVYCTGSSLSYTYNFGTSFAGPYSIVLTGSITANQTGTIATVFSLLNTCANNPYVINTNPMGIETSSPATCAAQTTSAPMPWGGYLTGANITPVNVTSGQLVQVIFTLTFS